MSRTLGASTVSFFAALALGCGRENRQDVSSDRNLELGNTLQRLIDSTVAATPGIPSLILTVMAPPIGFEWRGAAGLVDRVSAEKLTADRTFRIASNTKTYIAAAVLRLVEKGEIGLDDPIERHLASASVATLRRGGYDPAAITVRHLLHHTAGLFDYAMSPEYFERVSTDFGHRWTREEQLRFAVDHGKPLGSPGQVYHYSDTGYILLGELLERKTGLSLGAAVKELIGFDRLGIRHTYFESLDSVPPGTPERTHQYLDTADTYRLDPSHDLYGGGGIVTDVTNLARFYRALVRGEVFEKKETLDLMLTATEPSLKDRPEGGYGMGIGPGKLGDLMCYGHSGFWGTTARHCPSIDLTVAGSMNRSPDSTFTVIRVAAAAAQLVQAALDSVPAER